MVTKTIRNVHMHRDNHVTLANSMCPKYPGQSVELAPSVVQTRPVAFFSMVPMRRSLRPPCLGRPFSYVSGDSILFVCSYKYIFEKERKETSTTRPHFATEYARISSGFQTLNCTACTRLIGALEYGNLLGGLGWSFAWHMLTHINGKKANSC